jgi:hypothetical protein
MIGFAYSQEQMVLVTFSEPMDRPTLFNVENWTVYDESLSPVNINRIGVADNDSLVVVYLPFLSYKTNFIVRVMNVKDKAGNLISEHNSAWFYFDGYNPDEKKPYLILK